MANKYLDLVGLGVYDGKIKEYIGEKNASSLKFLEFADNAIKFYTNNPKGADETPAFTVDLPAEYMLDQAKTVFVSDFAWDNTTYPGSTNPNLDGEPVLVLAVKGETDTTYSFLSMKQLVDIYTGGDSKSISVTVDPTTNKITADVKISAAEGNSIVIKDDGLFVEASATIETITANEINALFTTE